MENFTIVVKRKEYKLFILNCNVLSVNHLLLIVIFVFLNLIC